MSEFFLSLLPRLLLTVFELAAGVYVLFVILAILFKAARFFIAYVRDATGRFIGIASFNLALWAVWGCRYCILRAGDALASLFRPVIVRIRPEDPEERKHQLAALSNALKDARGLLGLPEKYTKNDLKEAYRRTAKLVAPESGGTEGLLLVVNLARDALKPHAS
jgi:hypothetical protein